MNLPDSEATQSDRPGDDVASPEALQRRSQLLQGIADATHLLISYDVREREVLASIEILRQAARADRVCLQVTNGPHLSAGTSLESRCVGVDRWTSEFRLPMRWRRILSAHMPVHSAVEALPSDEAAVLEREGVKAVLSVPITADKVPRGHIRFDRMATAAGWSRDEIVALQTAANGYGSALAHVEALADLRESEARYRRLVENAPDFIYRMSLPDGNYEYISPAAEEMLGYDVATLLARPIQFRDAIHPGWRGYFETEWDKLIRGEAPQTYEYAIIHGKTGETRWLFQRNVLIRGGDGKVVAIEGIVSDITARKRAELKLRTQQSMLESIFRAAPVGIGVISDRVILQVNDRVCEMTGYTQKELIGRSVRKLYPTEADYEYVGKVGYGQLRRTGTGSVETRWQHKDGSILDVLLNSTPLDHQDLAAGITITALDITQRKRAETAMARSLMEKEALLQEIHHRVKNNLAVVSSMLGLQLMQMPDPALGAILEESRDRIQAMARVHEHLYRAPDLGHIAMGPYIEQLAQELRDSYGSDVLIDVEADDVQLGINQATPCALILNELITNALKHAFPKPTALDAAPRISVRLLVDDGSCHVTVADNGVGLSEPHSLRDSDSLGLYLVELLGRQLRSDLRTSTTDGARFEISFPIDTPSDCGRQAEPDPAT